MSYRRRRSQKAGLVFTSLLGVCLADCSQAADAAEAEKKTAAAPAKESSSPEGSVTNYNNWVEVSAGGVVVNGDAAAFQQRHQIQKGAFGGIEDFHWETTVGKKDFLQIDGRALFDNHDYGVRLELTRPKVGYLRGGYKQFRTWYDDAGGYLPPAQTWIPAQPEALALDRGEAWFEAGLTLPSYPSLILKYTHQFRDGQKDSTSWGYVSPPLPLTGVRGISPSFWDINETRDIAQGDAKYTIGKTAMGVGLRYESAKSDNTLNIRQWPNEPNQSYITSREEVKTDMFNVHAFTDTRFNEKVDFTVGFMFTTLDTDLGGSRVYGNEYDAAYNPALAQGLGFLDLGGGSQMNEYVVNLNLMLTPWDNLAIVPSIRIMDENITGNSSFLQTAPSPLPDEPRLAESSQELLDVSERLEARYTGVTNWVFYARGDWTEGNGDLRQQGGAGLGLPVLRYTEDTRWLQKYTIGATWYPLRRLNVDIQSYYKQRQNDYDNETDSTPNNGVADLYPAFLTVQNLQTVDGNIRITWRPLNGLTLISRYDIQYATIDTTPDAASSLSGIQSGKVNSQVFAQNITWVPWSRLYLQAGFNYVLSTTDTPAQDYTRAILQSQNNYWNLTFTTGLVLNDKTDLQVNFFHYRANDYEDNALYGVPYGAGADENAVTCGIVRRIRENLRLNLKYGFFKWTDQSTGGHTDYNANMVYSSLQYRF